jgi:hypothetical protein
MLRNRLSSFASFISCTIAAASLLLCFSNQGRKIITRGPSRVLGDSILSPLQREWTVARRVVEPESTRCKLAANPQSQDAIEASGRKSSPGVLDTRCGLNP